MIDVNVADAIYCSPLNLICQPLDWWSSAAAWAQAVLSALAIVGASLIAKKQQDRVRDQQIRSICGALQIALISLKAYDKVISEEVNKGVTIDASERRLTVISDALASMPPHEMPDHRLAGCVFTMAEIVAQAADYVVKMQGVSDPNAVSAPLKLLSDCLPQAQECIRLARLIEAEYIKSSKAVELE